MKLTITTLIAALIASSAWFAAAQRPEGAGEGRRGGGPGGPGGRGGRGDMTKMMPIYKCLDKDGDGSLSEEEIKNATEALLTLDKDKDGKLSAKEIAPEFPARGARGAGGGRTRGGDSDGGDRPQRPQRPETEKKAPAPKSE